MKRCWRVSTDVACFSASRTFIFSPYFSRLRIANNLISTSQYSTSAEKSHLNLPLATSEYYGKGESVKYTGGEGKKMASQKHWAIPGLGMLPHRQPSAPLGPPQPPQAPAESKGRQSKHAQRIQASKEAARLQQQPQPAIAQADPQQGPPTQQRQESIPKDLVEADPQWQNDSSRPRAVPSAASGGVPDPTTEYLAQALAPSSTLRSPRRILVIIDLNGTLLYRPSRRRPFHFVERPHAHEFLSYCLDTFFVAIWSSARPDNVRKMVAQLLTPEQVDRCVLVWARDRFGLDSSDYDARVQCYKRLTRVWADEAVQASCPPGVKRWDQTNTVLVDDSLEKGRSEPHNILTLPEFDGFENEPADVLPQVHDYVNTLAGQSNISNYMRGHRFRLNPSYVLPP